MMTLVHTLAVAEYLNFRHAANALGVAQSSVSARVKALEEDLGIVLFERHARGVRLTEAGRHFVERIAAGIDQLDHAVKTAGMAAAGESGRLRIGIHALIPRSFLAKLIGQYREDHPGVEVEMTEGTARDAVMQLRADRLDVVFVAGTPELLADPRFASTALRAANQHALKERLEAVFAQDGAAEWVARFAAAGVPSAPINGYAQALADPQSEHLRLVRPMQLPGGRHTRTVGCPVRWDGQVVEVNTRPPALNEHARAIKESA